MRVDIKSALADRVSLGKCGVIMPFAEEFGQIFDAIRAAVEGGDICFSCSRADEFLRGGRVMDDVLELIATSEVIVADLTGRNPNVFYELGLAHATKGAGPIVLIAQENLEDLPFDIRDLRAISYDVTKDGLARLQKDIKAAVSKRGEFSWSFTVNDGKSYRKGQKIFGLHDRNIYTFGLTSVEVAQGGATFSFDVHRLESGKKNKVPSNDRDGLEWGKSMEVPGLGWTLSLLAADGRIAKFGIGRRVPRSA